MRTSITSLCVVGVLVWTGASAWAQGKGGAARQGERASKTGKARDTSTATTDEPDSQDKPAKSEKVGKAVRQTDQSGPARGQKGGGPQGKKTGQPSQTAEKGKGKGGQQQLQAFQKQLQHERAKHMERQARLARIRELAVQKGDTEMIARVDRLIAKEQEVYGRKLQQLQAQQRANQPSGAVGGTTPSAGPTDVDKPRRRVGADRPKETSPRDANDMVEGHNRPEQEQTKTDEGATGGESGRRTKRQTTRDRQGEPQQ